MSRGIDSGTHDPKLFIEVRAKLKPNQGKQRDAAMSDHDVQEIPDQRGETDQFAQAREHLAFLGGGDSGRQQRHAKLARLGQQGPESFQLLEHALRREIRAGIVHHFEQRFGLFIGNG
jgi:hypothetical protein